MMQSARETNVRNDSAMANEHSSLKESLPYLVSLSFILGIFIGVVAVAAVNFIAKDEEKSSNNQVSADSDAYILSGNESSSSSDQEYYDASYINKLLNILEKKYIGDLPDKNTFNYELAKGIISALDDQYTMYLDPSEAQIYLENRTGDFEGVGVTLGYDGSNTFVESVLKGYPAESAGMLPNDFIVEVDGDSTMELMPVEVAKKIRGEKDTVVNIKVLRENEQGTYDEQVFSITRKKIEIDNVLWKELDNGLVEIDIVQFSDVDVQTFLDSWDTIVKDITDNVPEVRGIVVDLRNNPGGFVMGVRYILEDFLADDLILMQEETSSGKVTKYYDGRKGAFESVPLVVLVNEGSASASEIFAAAIQENDRGVVVGTETVGKGVEQELQTFDDGSMLLVVFQKWLTPDGNGISKDDPIDPDYDVENTVDDYKNGDDPQLDKALELLQ